jgi:CRISPR-associated protein Csx17
MNRIPLNGCTPDVLIHYLKALGILRLVGEQFDERVRGAWHGSAFIIESEKTADELGDFFLNKYHPTPIVAPWNGGGGFYAKKKSQSVFVDSLEAIKATRLDNYRVTIERAREIVGERAGKPEDKDEKAEMLRACRRTFPDAALEWLDAAFVLSGESVSDKGNKQVNFPPLLGSGGNDGNMEYTLNFIQRLLLVLPEAAKAKDRDKQLTQSERSLRFALFAEGTPALESVAVGQFHPGGAGGVNATQGVEGDSLVNPWDFVLAIEGTLLLASATTRQLAAGARMGASFPFTAQSSTVGYGTATLGESVRAEIWMPLWSRMSSAKEIAHVFGEGRARFGGQAGRTRERSGNEPRQNDSIEPRRDARSGFDFVRAIAELGVDRGIDAFTRYGILKRMGDNHLIVPLGRFEVPSDKETNTYAALIAEADGWLERLRRATRSTDKTPPRFIRARLNVEEAIFNLCASKDDGQRKEHLRSTLVALGAAQTELARSPKFRDEHIIPPLASLTVAWADACQYEGDEKGATEYRIACALASIVDNDGLAPVRAHLEPVEYLKDRKRFGWSKNDVRVVWGAGRLTENLALVLRRRWIDARREDLWSETRTFDNRQTAPIRLHAERAMGARRFARLADVAKFINREVDEQRIESLLRALMLVNWRGVRDEKSRYMSRDDQSDAANEIVPFARLNSAYALLKLLFLPEYMFKRDSFSTADAPSERERETSSVERFFKRFSSSNSGEIRHEPGIAPLLLTNNQAQISNALKRAAQRLKISGFTPFTDTFHLEARQGSRLAAALLIPLKFNAIDALGSAALRPTNNDSNTNDNGEN